jgi:hypothetical protein
MMSSTSMPAACLEVNHDRTAGSCGSTFVDSQSARSLGIPLMVRVKRENWLLNKTAMGSLCAPKNNGPPLRDYSSETGPHQPGK